MFDIKKTIEINLSQDGLEKLVRQELAIQHPDVDVTAVEFKATRNPAGVEVRIDAEFRNQNDVPAKTKAPKVEEKVPAKKTVVQETAPSPQPKEQSSSVEADVTDAPTVAAEPKEETFEEAEMSAIDATLAEEEEALDADKTDAEPVEEKVETSGDAEVEEAPQDEKPRKLLFPKKK